MVTCFAMQNSVERGADDERGRAAGAEPKYLVKTVARAAELLEVLAAGGPGAGLSVTEVAQRSGVSKSAAFGLLQTLRHYGLVADEGEGMNRRYRLGMSLARLGDRAQAQISLRDVARPLLRELTAATGMASRVAVPQEGQAVIVDQVDSGGGLRLDLRMGARELPHCTGIGKALLAAMPEQEARNSSPAPGCPAAPRAPSPTRRRSSPTCPTSAPPATRWTTRRTPTGSSASAAWSATTGTGASARSASPASSSICPAGGSANSASR